MFASEISSVEFHQDWLQRYGLPTDGTAGLFDIDHDGKNNWQELFCGTDPTNRSSAPTRLEVGRLTVAPPDALTI